MAHPTQASSPHHPTSHSSQLTVSGIAITWTSDSPRSSCADRFSTATYTNAHTSIRTHRGMVWQTPKVVVSNVATKFTTVITTHLQPTHSMHSATDGYQTSVVAIDKSSLAAATRERPPPLLQPSQDILPDWPPILAIFLLSFLIIVWVVTLILYLATFPEKLAWLDRFILRWTGRTGSAKRARCNELVGHGSHGARKTHPTRKCEYRVSSSASQDSTIAEGTVTSVAIGLGISFGDKLTYTPRLRRPRSSDPESLESPTWTDSLNAMSTAPLPSSRSFTALSPAVTLPKTNQAEGNNGHVDPQVAGICQEIEGEEEERNGVAGVLESVNAVIGFVAGRLARMASDQVGGRAEDGLLLPIRNDEREPPERCMGDG